MTPEEIFFAIISTLLTLLGLVGVWLIPQYRARKILELRGIKEPTEDDLIDRVLREDAEVVNLLLKSGIRSTVKDDSGNAALEIALGKGNIHIAKALLRAGEDRSKIAQFLFQAIEMNDLNRVRLLLEVNPQMDARDENGRGFLGLAMETDNPEILLALLNKGIDFYSRETVEVLLWAADRGYLEIIKSLLRAHMDANATLDTYPPTSNRETALHLAANSGHLGIVDLLLSYGANVNARNQAGNTALMEAVENHHSRVVQRLLQAGADMNAKNDDGQTPLSSSVNKLNANVINMFLEAGADPNDCDKYGRPLLVAACARSILAKEWGVYSSMEALLESGADPNGQDGDGNTALHMSCRNKYPKAANELLEEGANPNIRNEEKDMPLHLAAWAGDPEIIRTLVKKGVDVHAVDAHRRTPLMLACINGDLQVVHLIMEVGADLNARDELGYSALAISVLEGHDSITQALRQAGADDAGFSEALLLRAAKIGDINPVKELINKSVDLEAHDHDGATPLIRAVLEGHKEVARVLITAGSDVYAAYNSTSVLALACSSRRTGLSPTTAGDPDLVQYLIEHGADVHWKRDTDARNALFFAASSFDDNSAVIKTLANAKIDVNCQSDNGDTPLMLAARIGRQSNVQALIDSGADINLKDMGGRDALMNALSGRSTKKPGILYHVEKLETVKTLVAAGADVNARDRQGAMALIHLADRYSWEPNDSEIFQFLITAGADVSRVGRQNKSPLMYASQRGHTQLVQLLLDAGAEFSRADHDGMTSLMYAALGGSSGTVRTLLKAGADPNVKNRTGHTPLKLAVLSRNQEAAQELLKSGAIGDISRLNRGPIRVKLAQKWRTWSSWVIERLLRRNLIVVILFAGLALVVVNFPDQYRGSQLAIQLFGRTFYLFAALALGFATISIVVLLLSLWGGREQLKKFFVYSPSLSVLGIFFAGTGFGLVMSSFWSNIPLLKELGIGLLGAVLLGALFVSE